MNNSYDFIILFDVKNGNPNGDPNGNGGPRLHELSSYGYVTDVCLKSKIRRYVGITKQDVPGYKIYITENAILELVNREEREKLGINADLLKKASKDGLDKLKLLQEHMCREYFDIRTFGAVMIGKKEDIGHLTGPCQLSFAESVDPIISEEVTITRKAATNEKEQVDKRNQTMGSKYIVPYALYKGFGHISAPLANKTGFTEEDLNVLFEAMYNMFDFDKSSTRGEMAMRHLIIFKHESPLRNAPSHKLFDLVKITKLTDKEPASINDYEIEILDNPYENVEIITIN